MNVKKIADEDIETITCKECEEPMEFFNEKETIDHEDVGLNEDGTMWLMWKPSDCKLAAFQTCGQCHMLCVNHLKCGQPMLFTGHMGFAADGSQYMRSAKTRVKALLEKPGPIKNPDAPRFETIDLDKTHFRIDDWLACGPDDKSKHFWYCETCKENLSFSAK